MCVSKTTKEPAGGFYCDKCQDFVEASGHGIILTKDRECVACGKVVVWRWRKDFVPDEAERYQWCRSCRNYVPILCPEMPGWVKNCGLCGKRIFYKHETRSIGEDGWWCDECDRYVAGAPLDDTQPICDRCGGDPWWRKSCQVEPDAPPISKDMIFLRE